MSQKRRVKEKATCPLLQHSFDIRRKLLVIDNAEMSFYYLAILIDEYGDRHSLSAEVFCQPVVLPDREGDLEGIDEFLNVFVFALDENSYDADSSALIGLIGPLNFGDFLLALLSPFRRNVDHYRTAAQRTISDRFTVDGLDGEVLHFVFGEDRKRKGKNHKHRYGNLPHEFIPLCQRKILKNFERSPQAKLFLSAICPPPFTAP